MPETNTAAQVDVFFEEAFFKERSLRIIDLVSGKTGFDEGMPCIFFLGFSV